MAEAKDPHASIEAYIAHYPEDVQQILNKLMAVVKENAPEAEAKISYGMPGFFLNGYLVGFGVYKRHIGFYPKTAAMESLNEELAPYKGTKSSLHFPLREPVPYQLIGKLVRLRVEENRQSQAEQPT
jgi:uncharacterized protein YdhG (YjbR/CyaY superfamily)